MDRFVLGEYSPFPPPKKKKFIKCKPQDQKCIFHPDRNKFQGSHLTTDSLLMVKNPVLFIAMMKLNLYICKL